MENPRHYDGPIEPRLRFIWEPGKAHAHEHIEVVRLNDAGDKVLTTDADGREYWNDVSRFREAVVPLTCRLNSDKRCTALILKGCLCGSYTSWLAAQYP